ncbi:MAG: hypothetical protein A3E87_02840 [Gammaproteobacteria bacterium RIFCSPHIGHO2_12_FULL_35_23]|nr:MAG: hypothetical protein A3E87_02840 [Gammaproteobacteria bacterium RIFCSPHIGHO2_12_FULL_35_23]
MDNKYFIEQKISFLKNEIAALKIHLDYSGHMKLNEDLKEIICQKDCLFNKRNISASKLSQKSTKSNFLTVLANRIIEMLSPTPVINYLIASFLFGIVIYFINHPEGIKWLIKYKLYFAYFAQFALAITIIKSASKGLLLPLLALFIGSIAFKVISPSDTLFELSKNFYGFIMIIGILGTCISIIKIN